MFVHLLRFVDAHTMSIDLTSTVNKKTKLNKRRYLKSLVNKKLYSKQTENRCFLHKLRTQRSTLTLCIPFI